MNRERNLGTALVYDVAGPGCHRVTPQGFVGTVGFVSRLAVLRAMYFQLCPSPQRLAMSDPSLGSIVHGIETTSTGPSGTMPWGAIHALTNEPGET